jgi:hypothetical protein
VRNGVAADRVTKAAEETKNVNGALHFALGFGEGLAFLAGEEFGEFVFARGENFGNFAENASARDGGLGAPGGLRGAGGFNSSASFGFVALRIIGDDFALVSGIQILKTHAVLGIDPFATDEILVSPHKALKGRQRL